MCQSTDVVQLRFLILSFVSLWLVSCSSSSSIPSSTSHSRAVPQSTDKLPLGLTVKKMIIPKGTNGRHRTRSMRPRYITIHSTQNRARSANAYSHAKGLYNGNFKATHNSLGYLTWHFTIDQSNIYQSLPTNEQGQHADYEGVGNRASIGIEMCENRGNSRSRTVDRTARLTAVLMKKHGIWINNVVPHQHWRMRRHSDGRDLGHKNCPHFLMTNGKPGAKWRQFQAKVMSYYRQL